MKISAPFLNTAILAAASTAAAQPVAAEQSLEEWWAEAPFTIFPNHTGWDVAYDNLFHRDVKATFNFVEHDFDSLKTFFKGVFGAVQNNYEYLRIQPVDAVVVPGEGLGGIVSMTGVQSGKAKGSSAVRSERDTIFAVVDKDRKVTEWREGTNFF